MYFIVKKIYIIIKKCILLLKIFFVIKNDIIFRQMR